MKIYQILSTFNYGDAIGNDVIAVKHIIEDMNIETAVYAGSVSPRVTEPDSYQLSAMPKVSEDDIVIYHMANGSYLNTMVTELNCRKIMIYHNITPYEFFNIDNIQASENCRKGLNDMLKMKGKFNSYIADSQFNKDDMIAMGYKADQISVIPVAIPFDDYKQEPDAGMMTSLSDGMTNIVFVGRIAPNKKHEDIIRAFDYYKRNVNPNSRLILAGGANANGMYFNDLKSYIEALGTQDIIFPGHISFAEILAIYRKADVFLCLSEHEGFCVPLLEAMTFDVPIIAYDAGAVPETMGGSGIVVNDKDPVFLSKVIDKLVNDPELRSSIVSLQRKRLEDFRYDKIKKMLQDYINDFLGKFPPLSPDDHEKGYRDLYKLVEKNMKNAGRTMQFSQDALLHSARRAPGEMDVTALINEDYTTRSLIEAVYISAFNNLPDQEGFENWEGVAAKSSRFDFIKTLISSAVNSDARKAKDVKIAFNPFTTAELVLPEQETPAAEGGVVLA